jgi:sugar lactone lactonase YvrE
VSGQFDLVLAVEGDWQDNRLNDACVGAQGDLWFGTMPDPDTRPEGALYATGAGRL